MEKQKTPNIITTSYPINEYQIQGKFIVSITDAKKIINGNEELLHFLLDKLKQDIESSVLTVKNRRGV